MQRIFRIIKKNYLPLVLAFLLVCALVGQTLLAFAVAAQPQNNVKDENGRLAYLQSLGWQVAECTEVKNVALPQTFSSVYQNYNELQKQQGFDLWPYRGTSCIQYTYPLLNFPTQSQEVYLHLLTYKGVVIGGDIASVGLNGFMVPFK